jgi:hypothetical protein
MREPGQITFNLHPEAPSLVLVEIHDQEGKLIATGNFSLGALKSATDELLARYAASCGFAGIMAESPCAGTA